MAKNSERRQVPQSSLHGRRGPFGSGQSFKRCLTALFLVLSSSTPQVIEHQMSLFAILITSLFFFGFVAAGGGGEISYPACLASYEWSFNSYGQNPCEIAAYLLSTCSSDGSFTIPPLPAGDSYSGPDVSDCDDLCACNTVAYSLISACGACQGGDWIPWGEYAYNCVNILPPGWFPYPVPAGTSVPLWAFIDVTVEGIWDPVAALDVGDPVEAGPGTPLDPPPFLEG